MLTRLLEENVTLLRNACALLDCVDDAMWIRTPPVPGAHRLGPQFRHVIEFYDTLLAGLPGGRIDYDARRRDSRIESSVRFAAGRLRELAVRLETDRALRVERRLRVRMEDATPADDLWFDSSLGRELQSVRTHTIHHFALIALSLRCWGIDVDGNFGVAPSTLRFRAGAA